MVWSGRLQAGAARCAAGRQLRAAGQWSQLMGNVVGSEIYSARGFPRAGVRVGGTVGRLISSSGPVNSSTASTSNFSKDIGNYESKHVNGANSDLVKLFHTDPSLPSKSTAEIIRALSIYHLCSFPFFVQNGRQMFDLSSAILGQTFTNAVLKQTFFGHFCGGETEKDLPPVIAKLHSRGVGAILDYAAESELDTPPSGDAAADKTAYHESNTRLLISSISSASKVQAADRMERFVAMKVTALADPPFLTRVSAAIRGVERLLARLAPAAPGAPAPAVDAARLARLLEDAGLPAGEAGALLAAADGDGDGVADRLDLLDLLHPMRPAAAPFLLGPLGAAVGGGLTAADLAEARAVAARVARVAAHAEKCGVVVMVDAEQVALQPAIDRLTLDAMAAHNRARPVVFNTYQCYLRDALPRVREDLARSARGGFVFGAKVVRGAYVVQERRLAAAAGVPDPIQPNIDATHRSYHQVLDAILAHKTQRKDGTALMAATHNQNSIVFLLERLRSLGIPSVGSGIYFAQLLGMRDHLSFALGKAGFSVYKYVPYGPIREVMPYLLRRAEENSDMLSGAGAEVAMLWGELVRRLLPGVHAQASRRALH